VDEGENVGTQNSSLVVELAKVKERQEQIDFKLQGLDANYIDVFNVIKARTENSLDLNEAVVAVVTNPFTPEGKHALLKTTEAAKAPPLHQEDVSIPNAIQGEDHKTNFITAKQIKVIGPLEMTKMLIYLRQNSLSSYEQKLSALSEEELSIEKKHQLEQRIERTRRLSEYIEEADFTPDETFSKSPAQIYDEVLIEAFGSIDMAYHENNFPPEEVTRVRIAALQIANRFLTNQRLRDDLTIEGSLGEGNEKEISQQRLIQRLAQAQSLLPANPQQNGSETTIKELLPRFTDIPREFEIQILPSSIQIHISSQGYNQLELGGLSSNGVHSPLFRFGSRTTGISIVREGYTPSRTKEVRDHERTHMKYALLVDIDRTFRMYTGERNEQTAPLIDRLTDVVLNEYAAYSSSWHLPSPQDLSYDALVGYLTKRVSSSVLRSLYGRSETREKGDLVRPAITQVVNSPEEFEKEREFGYGILRSLKDRVRVLRYVSAQFQKEGKDIIPIVHSGVGYEEIVEMTGLTEAEILVRLDDASLQEMRGLQ
jgi:hypothetical protein